MSMSKRESPATAAEWDEFVKRSRDNGFPWCDTCRQPAVWRESWGMLHSTPEHMFGLPPHLDSSGHKVTMSEWWSM